MTATKLKPFRKKHMEIPTFAMRNPATAGPITRAPFTIELFRDTAFMRSSRLVISTMKACLAGMSKAMANPPKAASVRICQARMYPLQTRPANTNASTIIPVCV